jgi:hypothetical protein
LYLDPASRSAEAFSGTFYVNAGSHDARFTRIEEILGAGLK